MITKENCNPQLLGLLSPIPKANRAICARREDAAICEEHARLGRCVTAPRKVLELGGTAGEMVHDQVRHNIRAFG